MFYSNQRQKRGILNIFRHLTCSILPFGLHLVLQTHAQLGRSPFLGPEIPQRFYLARSLLTELIFLFAAMRLFLRCRHCHDRVKLNGLIAQ